jgi:O-antigen/teichoic acid export membrane protein
LTLPAPSLLIRAVRVTPHAVFLRHMRFQTIAIAEVTAVVGGGALEVAVALLGGSYWALVAQILTTDVLALLVLILAGAGIRPLVSTA